MTKNTVTKIYKELLEFATTKRKEGNEYFFKTGKGGYAKDDIFIGVRVPDTRKVAQKNLDISFTDLQKEISSPIHEIRLCAIIILVENFKKAHKNKDIKKQKQVLQFYLKNLNYVNNWDLVDLSTHYILGQAILNGVQDKKILDKLVVSKILWERRIAMVATWIFIRQGEISTTLCLAKKLLGDREDLMHKAVGWMLREAWKKDAQRVEDFLQKNYKQLPRTTLRYAIERMEETKRKKFLKGEFN